MTARSLFAGAALAAFLAAAAHSRASGPIPDLPAPAAGRWQGASMDEYRKHLQDLSVLVEACAKGRDTKTCDPALVGPDDRVPITVNAERRLVRFGWLRVLLAKAQEKDKAINAPKAKSVGKPENGAQSDQNALPPPPTTTALLQSAETRLAEDLAQTNAVPAAAPNYAQEREVMKQVLAGRDFRNLDEVTAKNSLLEKLGNWINSLFESAAQLSAHAAWVGRAIVWGFILAVCMGLAWGLLQLERRWRNRPPPEVSGPAPGAASAREWQLWLEDARKAAAAGQWREAIHFVYWAAISRLESRRLWPADRARTPREYLALVAPTDSRRTGLATLTGSFERTWYGGHAAGERDYRRAEQLASALISGSVNAGGSAQ